MNLRILIVEDEQIIAEDLAGKVARMGHRVVGTAITGEEAVELAERSRPDLVLMDIQLGGKMNGGEAAKVGPEPGLPLSRPFPAPICASAPRCGIPRYA